MSGKVMIKQHQAECPACGTILIVPPKHTGFVVRCGQCHERFELPATTASEDLIAEWLGDEEEMPAPVLKGAGQPRQEEVPPAQKVTPPGEIRLVKFDRTRALFEFPVHRLLEESFRCAMPRRCLQCSTRYHLEAHVIIFAPQLVTSISLEAERDAGDLVLRNVANTPTARLLQRLPKAPNVPHPADLPMPYWLCDMCSNSGIISGQIQVNSDTGEGWCRLLIGNLRRAEEFMMAAGGARTKAYAKLREFLERTAASRWEQVPLVMQNRIQQWFTPEDDEEFIGFVPNRDRQRTEDGMAGLVVSSKRTVYHTSLRHREVPRGYQLELQLSMAQDTGNLRIKTPDWEVKHFTVDRQGLVRLRRSLTLGHFKVVWR